MNNQIESVLIKDYENKNFKGINTMYYNSHDNQIYFTDSGKFEFGQCYPLNGSLFCIDLDTKIVKPILYECLSYPSDICYDHFSKTIYVCEPYANRITRIRYCNSGVNYASIFCQFNGRLGPNAMCMDEYGNLYVSRYEFVDNPEQITNSGIICVLNKFGVVIGELIIPKLPEITGIFISTKRKDTLYFTEKNNSCVMKIKLSTFITDIEKYQQKNKI